MKSDLEARGRGVMSVLVDGAPELKDGPAVRAELRADLEKLQRAVASANAFAGGVTELSSSLQEGLSHLASALNLGAADASRIRAQEIFDQLGDFAESLQHREP